jgi:hypothetical protein
MLAFGAAFDNPNLIVTVVIGNGEAPRWGRNVPALSPLRAPILSLGAEIAGKRSGTFDALMLRRSKAR